MSSDPANVQARPNPDSLEVSIGRERPWIHIKRTSEMVAKLRATPDWRVQILEVVMETIKAFILWSSLVRIVESLALLG